MLVTGLTLRFVGNWHWPRWILTALVLYAVLVVIGLAGYSPSLRRQIKALEAEGATSTAYLHWEGRARIAGIATLPVALAIIFMMVVRPAL